MGLYLSKGIPLFDVIIVGSGPAGMAAAVELQGMNVLMLDVGNIAPETNSLNGNLYDIKEKKDLFNEIIGKNFESLHNIDHKYLSPKLKGPLMRFITRGASELSIIDSEDFDCEQSFALGGLANAWGAGMLRFNDYDLSGFPIVSSDLEPFYDKLNKIIGISGEDDDLSHFFGKGEEFQPPHKLSNLGNNLLHRYQTKKNLFHKNGFYLGRNRIALLTEPKEDRVPCQYDNLEFFKPNIPAIYHPGYTIKKLINEKKLNYKNGYLVKKYIENNGKVEVFAENLKNGRLESFQSRSLILSAGCLNTSKIVLTSNNDTVTKLPILDNPISYVPFLIPNLIGRPIEKFSYSAQLVLVHEDPISGERLNASFYGLAGPLKSDIFFEFPLSVRGNFSAIKYLLSALAVVQFFFKDTYSENNYLKLNSKGNLEISYKERSVEKFKTEDRLISLFRKIGYFSHRRLIKYPNPGNSFHYAATLPMSKAPRPYGVNPEGRLWNTESVYIGDSANFSALPAKNHSYTIMANSMRIASILKRKIEK